MIEDVRSDNESIEAAEPVNPAPDHYIEGEAIPNWVRCTSIPETYTLLMYNAWRGELESLDLTREEYLTLKRHLAVSRGFPPNVITVEETN